MCIVLQFYQNKSQPDYVDKCFDSNQIFHRRQFDIYIVSIWSDQTVHYNISCWLHIFLMINTHYSDVIIGAIVSQITSLTSVYSTV